MTKVFRKRLRTPQWKLDEVRLDIEQGLLSKTEGPITVTPLEGRLYLVMDGHHRILESKAHSFEAEVLQEWRYVPYVLEIAETVVPLPYLEEVLEQGE
jgi:hypothetical protein